MRGSVAGIAPSFVRPPSAIGARAPVPAPVHAAQAPRRSRAEPARPSVASCIVPGRDRRDRARCMEKTVK